MNPNALNTRQQGGLFLPNKHLQFGGALTKGQQYRKSINRRQDLAAFRNRGLCSTKKSRYDEFNDIIAQAQAEALTAGRNKCSSNTYTRANDLPPPSRTRSLNSIVASSVRPPSNIAPGRSMNSIIESIVSERPRTAAPSSTTQRPASSSKRDLTRKRSSSRSLESIVNNLRTGSSRPSTSKKSRLTAASLATLPSIDDVSTGTPSITRTPSSFSVSRSGSTLSGEFSEMSESEPEMPPPPSPSSVRRATTLSNRDASEMMRTVRSMQPSVSSKNLHKIISGWNLHGKNVGMEKTGSPAAVRRLFNLMGQKQAADPNSYYRQILSKGEELDFEDEYSKVVRCLKGKNQRGRGRKQKGGMIGVAVPATYITAAKIIAALAPAAVAAGTAGKIAASSVASAAVPAVVQKALDRRSEKD